MVIENATWETIRPIVLNNISHEARVLTDEAAQYTVAGVYFAGHETVNHKADEYVRLSDRTVHTNTVEGYYSIFKRGSTEGHIPALRQAAPTPLLGRV